jgi:hypothetical protein
LARGREVGAELAAGHSVGRTVCIRAGIASQLAASGWDIAFTYWARYDERMRRRFRGTPRSRSA